MRRWIVMLAGSATGVLVAAGLIGVSLALWTDTETNAGNTLSTDSLAAPTSLAAVASGSDVALSWTVTPDLWAAGYQIWRGTTPGCCYSLHDTVAGQGTTSYTDVGANAGGGAPVFEVPGFV